jgi:AraC-like DNA-binding protein
MLAHRTGIPAGLVGELRRTAAAARLDIDHVHDEVEFDLVVKGTGRCVVGNQVYMLKPGTLIWLMAGRQHRLVRSPQLEMWVVSLRPELLDADRIAELGAHMLKQLPGRELVDLDRLASQVAQDSDEPSAYNAGITYLVMRALRASRESPPARARPMHAAVTRAIMLLRQREAISLSDLAAEAGVTAPYLSRLLIGETGRSFVDWRNKVRLDRFMEGYRPGGNLLAAALDAGFGSYVRFHRVFTETIGCTPSEWVRQTGDRRPPLEEAAASPAGYGVPEAGMLSIRQRWTALVPAVSPAIPALLGRAFLDRLLAASLNDAAPVPPQADGLDATLSPPERRRLIAALRAKDATAAANLAELVESHDFPGVFARVLDPFGLSVSRLPDAVTAFVIVVWVAANRGPDPGLRQVEAVSGQVREALRGALAGVTPRQAQDAHMALMCQFVVLYRALEATRAAGDALSFAQLSDAAVLCGSEAFDGDVTLADLAGRGLVRRAPLRSPKSVASRSKRAHG